VWRMAKRGRLIAMIAVSIAILLSAFGLPVTAYGPQNSGQNNPGGYVKYTLDLLNDTLINGNFVNTGNALEPWGIAYDPSNGYLYVTNYGSDSVSVINGATNTVIANITVGSEQTGVAYDPSNGYLYVAVSGSDSVSVINGATNTVIATIPVGSGPMGVAYDPSNGYIYVTNWNSDSVSVINGTTVIADITVGTWPMGVAYDPSNGYIYVTNYGSDSVSVIDGANNTVIANITVGSEPWGVAYDPSNGYIYVTNHGSGTVSIISTSTQVTNTSPPPSSSSLAVLVYNVLGRPATTVPGVVLGVLYNSSGFKEVAFMNSSGYLNFYGVSPGTYTLEVYHYPNTGLNLTEYWGGMTVNLQPGSNFVTFYRHEPWIYNLQASASNGSIVVTVTVNGTVTSSTQGEIELWVTNKPSFASPYRPFNVIYVTINPGLNTFNFTYPVSQAGTYYVYAAVLTYISTYTVTDQWNWTATTVIQPPTPLTLPQNYQVILNLLNGQQYFGVPHVYMGYYDDNVTTQWPAYYSPLNASQYWSLAGISSNQPVLELLGAALESSGAMYWPTYYEGGNITISFIMVYTAVNSTILGNLLNPTYAYLYTSPISVYLFIKPLGWSISSTYNFSIPCASPQAFVNINSTYGFLPIVPMIPWSTANYLIVTWFPTNLYQWTIEVANTTLTYPLTLTYLGGNGTVKPKPGDLLNVTITYNPNTNTIYGMIRDLNTSETSTFTASLSGNLTPPSSGYYVFGIGTASEWEIHCGTACCSCTGLIPFQANWALLYAAASQQPITPPPTYFVIFREVGLPPGTAWNVTLNGVTKVSSSSSIIFTVPNGEYNYSVASPILVNGVEYIATEPTGTVTVNNTNVTITVQYVPVSTTEKLEVYSQFVKYFYSGFNLPNRFFVAAPSINGNQPSNVTGYIAGANVTLSFTYNSSSGYWVSNEVNMGVLKPGSYELTVYAVYGNNYVVEGTYSITVLEPPPIVLTLLSYTPISSQAFELKLSNLGNSSIPLGIGYEWSLEKNITGLFNNTYEIKAKVILKYELEQDIPLNYLSGNYSTSLEFPIFVTLGSNGTVSIGGGISKNLVLQFGPANVTFTVGGSAQGNLAISNYQVVLQSIDASAFLSAYGTYNIPTPLGYEFSIDDIAKVQIGLIVSISLGASAYVKAVLIPVNNTNSTIPLAFKDVSGNVFIPFGVEGTVGASVHVEGGGKDFGNGLGASGGLQGVAGVGFLLQPGGSSLLESPGGAMVGEVNVFVVVKLAFFDLKGSWTILGPGVIYEWGSVPNSDIALFEDELQQAAQQFQQQVIGSDWVNGSTFGIITNNTSFGYGYSITNYNGLVYIYYTELTPSGVAVIRGLVFNGTTAIRAPLPTFNDLGEASPLLVTLNNGSLMMLWAGVPMGTYNLNNLTILLQGSVLNNNTWGPVVNLTKSGDAMSYASDGEYIYLVYEPKLSLTYNNTVLEELTPTGVVVRALSIPGVVGIIGVSNGLVIVQFINGTYALVNMNTGVVEPINAGIAGFSSGLLFYFYNGTLTVVNGTQRLAISLPIYTYAFPVAWSHGLVIIAWRPGLLSVFNWNGTVLQPIRNYTTAFTIIPGASIIDNTLYLTWFGLVNTTNGNGSIYMAIQPLPHPTNQSTTTTTTTVNVATTTSSVNTSTSSVIVSTTSSMTNSVKPSHSALPTWVAAAVAVIVVLVLIIALLMGRRSKQ